MSVFTLDVFIWVFFLLVIRLLSLILLLLNHPVAKPILPNALVLRRRFTRVIINACLKLS